MEGLVRVVILTAVTCAFLAIIPEALACECPDASAPPPCARFWRSNIVFTALVTKSDHAPDKSGVYPENTVVRLKVLKVFRGTIADEILDTQGEDIDCRGVYETGQQYLIYADAYDKTTNMVKTTPCFGRAKVSDCAEDFKYINGLTNHVSQSSIAGSVLERKYKPLAQIKILVEGMGKTYETCTDERGRYNISVDQPGQYRVTVIGPFTGASFSYGADDDSARTSIGIQYKLQLVKGQCDYREVTVF
jgi:hypothetical protein